MSQDCNCHKPKYGCNSTLQTPTPFITNSTCNSGCEYIHPSNCVQENKWLSFSDTDYAGTSVISPSGDNTLFKIIKLKYRKTRSKLEIQGVLECTNNFTIASNIGELLFLNTSFLSKLGYTPLSNTLELHYPVHRNNLVLSCSGFIYFKDNSVFYIHRQTGTLVGDKVFVNLVFDNNYDL